MTRTTCILGLLLTATAVVAQPPPPSPVPSGPAPVPSGPTPSPVPYGAPPSPLTYTPPPPPLAQSPLLAPPQIEQEPGVYVIGELAFLQPSLSFALSNRVPVGPAATLRVPSVSLDATVSPKLEIGYRLPEGGAFAVSYRFLSTEGTGAADAAQIRTRLDMQVFDFDYLFTPFTLSPHLVMTGRLGGRLANVFFDSRATDDFGMRQSSNNFFGAGVHGRVQFDRSFDIVPGLSAFGRIDGAALVGENQQRFRLEEGEVWTNSQRGQQTAPVLNLQAGVSYAPPRLPGLKFSAGYEYEEYFNVAGLNPSNGDVWAHGVFLRGRYDF